MTATLLRPGEPHGPGDDAGPSATGLDHASILLTVLDAALAAPTLAACAAAICTRLARLTGARRVALGWCDEHRCRVIGLSDSIDPKLPSQLERGLQAVMFEAIDQAVLVDSQAQGPDAPMTQMAVALAKRHRAARVVTVPFGLHGVAMGALTAVWEEPSDCPPAVATLLTAAARLAADLLPLIERGGWSAWRRLVRPAPQQRSAPDRATPRLARRWWAGAAAVLATLVLALPLPHSLSAEARVEGAVQRLVAAPVDGYLKEVLVRPGDVVQTGQPLARLGERELDLERLRLASELSQRQSEKTVALAKADRAALMIAQARIDEVQAKLDLTEQQLQRMELRAPIDGVMIEGDLARSVGAPLERGQPLFTLAPADRYRIVIELDERDIGQVNIGQPGSLALSALPWDTIALSVTRVGAAARVIDTRNVFEIEAEPNATNGPLAATLRPGLRGVARLQAPAASLGQRLATRLTLTLRRGLWRWWP